MTQQSRISMIDGLRGFSLLGILIANMLIFQYGLWGKDTIHVFGISSLDQSLYIMIKILIEGSFMPIFTFLFGYSLIMMRNSLAKKRLRQKTHLCRRGILLIVIGVLHGTYLWEGDILFVYGVMSLFLLLFINRKAKTTLTWAFTLSLLLSLTIVSDFIVEEDTSQPVSIESYVTQTNYIYSTGTYLDIKNHRNHSDDPMLEKVNDDELAFLFFFMPLTLAPMFLFGMYAAKKKAFYHPEQNRKYYRTRAIFFLFIGLLLKTYGYFNHGDGMIMVGGMVLAFGYIYLFGLLYSDSTHRYLLKPLEHVGKLSLTNYIMQTILCTSVFYGYGFGLFGSLGILPGVILCFIIFGLQMLLSTVYLTYFHYGPLEKLLRIGTYLSFSNNKKPHHSKKNDMSSSI